MCVGSVCTHPSYNDKNPPSVFFFNPYFKIPFLKSGWGVFQKARLIYRQLNPELSFD